jgi:hypothetical protein
MSKRIISDIVPKRGATVASPRSYSSNILPTKSEENIPEPKNIKSKNKSKTFFWGALAALLLWVAVGVFNARMEVNISPISKSVPIDYVLTVAKDSGDGIDILFNTLGVTIDKEGVFTSAQKQTVEKNASGRVVLFNRAQREPQILVATTRLETPDGKIYRIPKRVSIPGYTLENGELIPGSLEVSVSSDKPGSEYNIGLTDFTIPGFKGSTKFETIFARSKTTMEGGFVGFDYVVEQSVVDGAALALTEQGARDAESALLQKLPPEMLFISGTVFYDVNDIYVDPAIGDQSEEFAVRVDGEASGVFVNKKAFDKALSESDAIATTFGNMEISITNVEELSISPLGFQEGVDAFRLRVTGNAIVQASIDENDLRQDLLESGLDKAEFISAAFPAINSASVRFKPFWLRSLPSDPSRIDIVFNSI